MVDFKTNKNVLPVGDTEELLVTLESCLKNLSGSFSS